MIFVANQNGSHNWREAMKTEDFLQGTELLWHTVCDYDKPESERSGQKAFPERLIDPIGEGFLRLKA